MALKHSGEGGEDGSQGEGEKLEADEDTGSMTPNSAASPAPQDDDAGSPTPGDVPSPSSPRSLSEDPINCRDLPSSRCNSRESSDSLAPPRCPSNESLLMRGMPLGAAAALSPVGVALPATLPAAAAAALLPPQSAAMAAYLNAAAHRLMMTSPLPPGFNRASVSPLVSSSCSPPSHHGEMPLLSPPQGGGGECAILDFSKRSGGGKQMSDVDSDSDVMNLSKPGSPPPNSESPQGNGPLDLSVSRKRAAEEVAGAQQPPSRKPRSDRSDFKPQLSQWPSHLPFFAAAVAAASTSSLSPKASNPSDLWNGKMKSHGSMPSDATKALEKMSELSKLGGEDLFRSMAAGAAAAAAASPGNAATNRHSAWQSHWLNKGAEQAKDVLKCVWCKQSFPSLAAMTTHMKEAKHCGVNVPVPPMQPQLISQPQMTSPSNTSTSSTNSNKPSDLNMLIKETMPLPRKLVRGQDVWLGKGAEQTRQILKCMWCGQSFRSLAEMTSHMQQTQHYTNIISQEQIISWRSTDDPKGGGGGSGGSSNQPPGGPSSHVSAVLTCKVCDQAFTSLKELSNHMVKNSHYKEHIMRSITESGGRRRQTREKRKKSLPVRKLLELERAQHDFKNGDSIGLLEKMREPPSSAAGRITCEKCGNKIETSLFVDHIRQCVGGGPINASQRNFLKSALMSTNSILPPESPNKHKSSANSSSEKSPSPVSTRSPIADLSNKDPPPAPSGSEPTNNGSSPSVLNAIEKLIEKSFDSRSRQSATFPGAHGPTAAPMGSSILKRLGIDESVDYTKPLVDAQTMNLLRSYHQQQQHHYARRERSGSESSSISERGSSRIDSLTPERKMEPPGIPPSTSTPRSTPDKRELKSPLSERAGHESHEEPQSLAIKKEVLDEEVEVKREVDRDEDNRSYHSNGPKIEEEEDEDAKSMRSPREVSAHTSSPCRNSASPASSDRSGTPRSSNGESRSKAAGGSGSLGALSSMFDSLSGNVPGGSGDGAPSSGKRGSSHPLAALQKLCDKTETHSNNRGHGPANSARDSAASGSIAATVVSTNPGAILAFSWACNDAVMTSDSIMKCAFCDTPFISKGAYRHHLSKMHFVKDGVIPDPIALKAATQHPSNSAGAGDGVPLKGTTNAPPLPGSTGSKSPPGPGGFEESPHSKFLKYTELAKQLSSKYV